MIEVDESSSHEKKLYRLLEMRNRIDIHLNSKECSKCKQKIHISNFSSLEEICCNTCNGLGENEFLPFMEMIVLRINVNEDIQEQSLVTRKHYKDNDNNQISYYYEVNERGESVMTNACIFMNSFYTEFEKQDEEITQNDQKLLIYEMNANQDIVTDAYLNDYDNNDNRHRRYPSNIEMFESEDIEFEDLVSFL